MSEQVTPSDIMHQFDQAWNQHNVDQVMGSFADDGVVEIRPGLPGMPDTYRNKTQIQRFVDGLMRGVHVESHDAEARGDELRWRSRISSDEFRQLGLDTLSCDVELKLNQQGKVERLVVTVPPSVVALIEGAPKTR